MKQPTVSQTLEKQLSCFSKLHNVPSPKAQRTHGSLLFWYEYDATTCLLTSTKFLCNSLSEKMYSTGVQAGPHWLGLLVQLCVLSTSVTWHSASSLILFFRSHCLLFPFVLWWTPASTACPILSIDVSDLMASKPLAEISSQFFHSPTWTVINRMTSRPLSVLVVYLFALYWDLATTGGTRRF